MSIKILRVGVTMKNLSIANTSTLYNALDVAWSFFLKAALPNAIWIALPNIGKDIVHAYCQKLNISCLLLTGGENIGTSPVRDATEQSLLDWAEIFQIPVLGICRGMQMMAHWAGAGLHPVEGHVRTRHQLSGAITANVNSYHNFALTGCPDNCTVLAHSEDGEIEAIRHSTLPWEGWMWHPEREADFASYDIQRLQALFGA